MNQRLGAPVPRALQARAPRPRAVAAAVLACHVHTAPTQRPRALGGPASPHPRPRVPDFARPSHNPRTLAVLGVFGRERRRAQARDGDEEHDQPRAHRRVEPPKKNENHAWKPRVPAQRTGTRHNHQVDIIHDSPPPPPRAKEALLRRHSRVVHRDPESLLALPSSPDLAAAIAFHRHLLLLPFFAPQSQSE